MNLIFVALSCIIFMNGASGASLDLPTSINKDAAEIGRVWVQVWSSKPPELLNRRPLAICPFIDNCCADEDRLKAIELMGSSL